MKLKTHFEKKSIRWGAAFFIMMAALMGLFEKLELIVIDLRYQMSSHLPSSDILLVVVDKESLKRFPQWPWPRSHYADVISILADGGAKVIGLDFDFSVKSHPLEDKRFIQAVEEAGNVVLSAFHEDKIIGGNLRIRSASLPLPGLSEVAQGIGSILFPIDPDGKIRRAPWRDTIQGEPLLSLALEMIRQADNLPENALRLSGRQQVQIDGRTIPLHADGTFYIGFTKPGQLYKTVSFADVLENQIDPAVYQDKLVLIGGTAIELRDIWASPFGLMPGVEIQAHTLQSILSGQTLYRAPIWWTLLTIFGGALLLEGTLVFSLKRNHEHASPFVLLTMFTFGICLLYAAVAVYAFIHHKFIIDIIPVLSVLVTHYFFASFAINLSASRAVYLKTKHLLTLNTMSEISIQEQPLDRSVTFIFEMVRDFLSIRFMVLDLFDAKADQRTRQVIKGTETIPQDRQLNTQCEEYVMKAYRKKESIIIPNIKYVLASETATKKPIQSSLFIPVLTHDKNLGVLHFHSLKAHAFDDESVTLLYTVANQLAMNIENFDLVEEVNQLLNSSIEAFTSALELRDNETEGHSQRVAAYAQEVGKLMRLEPKQLDILHQGSLLHDIGKIGIPDAILRKPGRLDIDEMETMKNHPEYGYHMLKKANFPDDVAKVLLHHHEQYDGSGYPGGLLGDQIIIYSRIFMVVDAYDAIVSNRPYRKGAPYEHAIDEIMRCTGSQFDPSVVDAFVNIPKDHLIEIRYKVDEYVREKGLSQHMTPLGRTPGTPVFGHEPHAGKHNHLNRPNLREIRHKKS